ncbi:MAG: hypothetical protein ACR2RL_21795 [Gammaproteobacteria bacterium]
MARRDERSLGDVRAELRTRLGFVHRGSASSVQDALLDSFIAEAQETLVWEVDFPVLRREHSEHTIAGERLYDLPDDCDARRVRAVAVALAGVWRDMEQGIEPAQDTYRDVISFPYLWDMIEGQLELYPTPGTTYPLRVDYYALPAPLTKHDQRLAIDSRLVFLQALTVAKAHYRQPDAEAVGALMQSKLRNLKAGSHIEQRYSRLRPRRRNVHSAIRPVMV